MELIPLLNYQHVAPALQVEGVLVETDMCDY